MNCLNCGVELKTAKYQPSAVQKLVTGKCLDCVYEERRQKTEWWVPCGTCRHRLGFGIKNLGRRYGFSPASIRSRLIVRGVYRPGIVNPMRRGKRRWLSRVEKLIMEHYRRELVASDRHGKMMTEQMVWYYLNHDSAKEASRRRTMANYHNKKCDPAFKAKRKAAMRRWSLENKNRKREIASKWRRLNMDRVREYRRRLESNPVVRAARSLRGRVREYLSGVNIGGCKGLTGLTHTQLKRHIQKQFSPEMSWGNYGDVWHVDHIIPCAMFDLTKPEGVKKCFNYKNLQPLLKEENAAKGSLLFTEPGTLPMRVSRCQSTGYQGIF